MTTLRTLAEGGLAELYITEEGQTATHGEFSVALSALLDVLETLPEYGAGRPMVDRTADESLTARPDDRVICTVTGLTIKLPEDPEDGTRVAVVPLTGSVTVTPQKRNLEGAVASQTVSTATQWAYRADLADWMKTSDLGASSESPYPKACDGALKHLTAMEAASEFQVQISPELAEKIRQSKNFLYTRYVRPRDENWEASLPWSATGPGRIRRYR